MTVVGHWDVFFFAKKKRHPVVDGCHACLVQNYAVGSAVRRLNNEQMFFQTFKV